MQSLPVLSPLNRCFPEAKAHSPAAVSAEMPLAWPSGCLLLALERSVLRGVAGAAEPVAAASREAVAAAAAVAAALEAVSE
jgi:hypothetical protein